VIPIAYVVGAIGWIFTTDRFLAWITDDLATLERLQLGKGVLFVLITFALLLLLVSREARARDALQVALSDVQRRLETFLTSVPVAVLVIADGKLRFMNPVALRVSPPAWKPGAVFAEVAPPEVASAFAEVHAEIRREGRSVMRMLRVEDQTWEVTHVPLFDANGALEAFASLGRDVTEERRAREGLKALTSRSMQLREEEQARISRDLHDELGQSLTALKLRVRSVEDRLDQANVPHALIDDVVETASLVDQALAELRRIAQGLRPAALETLGLPAALQEEVKHAARRANLESTAQIADVQGLDESTSTVFFRVAQEALTNVTRHAHARAIKVSLSQDSLHTRLRVEDDGVGLPSTTSGQSLGLLGMTERASQVGGDLRVERVTPHGTVVCLDVPRRAK
jgi:signal transduction histidine kinase